MSRFKSVFYCSFYGIFLLTILSCQKEPSTLFKLMEPDHTNIKFANVVEEKPGSNILESEFFYNGAGVAVGDINNDSLPDLFFTANTRNDALYLNRGNFQFENITKTSGISDSDGWTAGTSMVDINGDGLMDIYVCKAGEIDREKRRNKLFINNSDLTFTEKAADYGLADSGYCTQAVFFDFDLDGDLDVYIVNYSVKRSFAGFDLNTIRNEYEPGAADRFYRNENGTFKDISSEVGLIQNPLGFGLSATVSDLTKNGWPDIYVANDFIERDYMYMNQGGDAFSEEVLKRTQETSYYSMGSDIADINNDGLTDIFVVDMLPYEYPRRRVFKKPDYSNYEQLASVYHRKNMRNVLQINNGNGTFTEVGQLAGISKTDWSWSSLIADFDNDGMKDIFVTNGFPRFYTDLDYLNKVLWKKYPNENYPDDPKLRYELVKKMQKVELHNFAFRNMGDLSFTDVSKEWGVNQYSVSGGAAYADLNDDGALDLIVNNINEPPLILKNTVRERNGNNYLKVRLEGKEKNISGIGAKVTVTSKEGEIFYQENFPVRGYQSSVDPVLLFGLGSNKEVDVEVIWPDHSRESVKNIVTNQTITFRNENTDTGHIAETKKTDPTNHLFILLDQIALGLNFNHQGSSAQDRNSMPLMPHTLSNLGPALDEGDVNSDGLQDLFVGGGKGQPAALYLQQPNGRFSRSMIPAFEKHQNYHDIDAEFFDANGNGFLDLYVVSGGNHDITNGSGYQDRLYINDGRGHFQNDPDALPQMRTSGSTVTIIDINDDSNPDLFIGGRVVTNLYPFSPRSYVLENNNGVFTDITEEVSPELMNPGMVTDTEWADINGDNRQELILVGEFMPVRIFEKGSNKNFREITDEVGLQKTEGWWNSLKVADLNNDGHKDLIAGNWGLNSSFKAEQDEPIIVYADDFNNDGFVDPIMTQVIEEKHYPVPNRDRLLQQLPEFQEKFPDYNSYSTATIEDILSRRQMNSANQLKVHTFASTVFKNKGDGTFQSIRLPHEAQVAPIFDMIVSDFTRDGIPDILVAGNNYGTVPENGPVAGQGLLLKGVDGVLDFTPVKANKTGFIGVGEARKVKLIDTRIGTLITLGRYADSMIVFHYRDPR